MTATELSKEAPTLAAAIAPFSKVSALASIAGFFLDARCHANHLRIETLVIIAAAHAKGSREPSAANVSSWFDALARTQLLRGEDPAEDVILTRVCWDDGNRLVQLGRLADVDVWVHCIFRALDDLPSDGDFGLLRQSVRALLRISDAALQGEDLPLNGVGSNEPSVRRLPRIGDDELKRRASAISFSSERLIEIGVTPQDIQPFVLTQAEHEAIADQEIDQSDLNEKPLIRSGNTYVLAFVPAVIT